MGPIIATEDGFRGGRHDRGTAQSRLSLTSRGRDFWWWTELRRLQLRRRWPRRRLLREVRSMVWVLILKAFLLQLEIGERQGRVGVVSGFSRVKIKISFFFFFTSLEIMLLFSIPLLKYDISLFILKERGSRIKVKNENQKIKYRQKSYITFF